MLLPYFCPAVKKAASSGENSACGNLLAAVAVQVAVAIERKQLEKALRGSEERFQKMLGLVPDIISIHDPEMNGRDLAARLLASYPLLKRLFMSGYTASDQLPVGSLRAVSRPRAMTSPFGWKESMRRSRRRLWRLCRHYG